MHMEELCLPKFTEVSSFFPVFYLLRLKRGMAKRECQKELDRLCELVIGSTKIGVYEE